MDKDEIELDVVEQESCAARGLRPWILIYADTGEIYDSEDCLRLKYLASDDDTNIKAVGTPNEKTVRGKR